MKSIRVHKNIWGNYCCFIGTRKAFVTCAEWYALEWIMLALENKNFKLSDNSYFSIIDVNNHVAKIFKLL